MNKIFGSNKISARMIRTIIQQAIAAVIAMLVAYQTTGRFDIPAIMAGVTLFLTWAMGAIAPSEEKEGDQNGK